MGQGCMSVRRLVDGSGWVWWRRQYGGSGPFPHSTPLPKDIVLRARRGEDIAVDSFEMLQGEMWENPSSTLFLVLSLLFIPEPC